MQNNERIVQLLYRRLKSLPLTAEEDQELDTWLARSEANRKILENLSDQEWIKEAKKRYYAPGKEAGLAQLREQLFEGAQVTRTVSLTRRFAYAASILIILSIAIYYLIPTKQSPEASPLAQTEIKNHQLEITPGGKAILTLSNGSNTPLDEHTNGLLAQLSNGRQLFKQDGKLVYQYAEAQLTAEGVDTSADLRSDQYSVVLPDGSRVWLNRSSKLIYPEQFSENSRTVEVIGEAYFEIAKAYAANGKDRIPFKVKIPAQSNSEGACEVEVLGTHFNIYAHNNEPVRTTLTEGKVIIHKGVMAEELKVNQQAVVAPGAGKIEVRKDVYVDGVLAWRENKWLYKEESAKNILRDLARYYNVGSAVTKDSKKSFTLNCDRNKPLSEVIDLLNEGDTPTFKLMNNTLVIVGP